VTFGDRRGETGPSHEITPVRPGVYEVRLFGRGRLNVYRDRLEEPALGDFSRAFEALREDLGIIDAVCIAQLPFWRPLAAHLRGSRGWRLVYDSIDRHGQFSTNAPSMVDDEALLAHESDLVVATSRLLYDEQQARNPRCIRVPNAADFAHFSVFIGEIPERLRSLRHPVIGYYGAIAEWFDAELVGAIARLRPSWSLVLVGGTFTADLRPVARLPNVHLPGEQPYAHLPAFLHAFDACIIPFKRLPLTEAADPVKFYEYLSAGKPVVSVPLPELEAPAAEGLVALAEDAASFVHHIERALAEEPSQAAARRRRYAEQHTWSARYGQFADAIRDLHPMASIVIPTHDNLHLTRMCIDAIRRNTSWPNYEIVVVDNASTDGTVEYLRDLQANVPKVRAIFNERNEGFACGINRGVAAAAGEYIVLLNNDTLVTRGWLSTMIRQLEAHTDVGMIGPATNQAGNESRIPVAYGSLAEMEAFAERYTRAHAGAMIDLDMLGFFCAVIPRRVLDQIGLLDERFGLGMFEDDDFSLRVRRAGFRLVCTDAAFVHHFHSATMRRLSPEEYRRLFEANRVKFEQKWGVRWSPHRYRWQH
jgi:GT2 family glycosyltransferase/glycosyltransferase involved in cell wall biosynthesis